MMLVQIVHFTLVMVLVGVTLMLAARLPHSRCIPRLAQLNGNGSARLSPPQSVRDPATWAALLPRLGELNAVVQFHQLTL
jgi:hypothetical protein